MSFKAPTVLEKLKAVKCRRMGGFDAIRCRSCQHRSRPKYTSVCKACEHARQRIAEIIRWQDSSQ